jgi:cell division septal protein FtsQ
MAKKATKKTTSKNGSAKGTQRPGSRRVPRVRQSAPSRFTNYFLPAIISLIMFACLIGLVTLGYRTVTASEFFAVKDVSVTGTSRASADDIRRIVSMQTERAGVWNVDIADLRQKIEKLPFVKFAAVSRALPNGMKVVVTERIPIGIVKLSGGSYLIDADGEMLAPPKDQDSELITINGWDEGKTERAYRDNAARIKLFQKMLNDWNEFGLVKRVKDVNLSDLQEPQASVEDSGSRVAITLARDDLSKSLRSALEAIAGKGERVRSVNAAGVYPVLEYIGAN